MECCATTSATHSPSVPPSETLSDAASLSLSAPSIYSRPVVAALLDITRELSVWLLLGAAVAGLLHVALPPGWLRTKLRGRAGVIRAVLLGVPLPLCSCGVIPAGIGLKRDGASDGASLAFLISTPQTGVDSVMVSGAMLGWPFAIFKLLSASVLGLVGGTLGEFGP